MEGTAHAWRVLARNEWLKAKRRPAAMVCIGLFATVQILAFANRLRSDEGFTLPEAWGEIIAGAPQVAALIGVILVILLVTNEFEWRTARQNVIDGLSPTEWFRGKLALVPILLAVFLGTQVLLGLVFAVAGSGGSVAGMVPAASHWKALGGVSLGFAGYASVAMAIALAVRSAGASVGVFFIYALLVEELLASWLPGLWESLVPVVRHLPLHVFDRLMSYARWDPEGLGGAAARAADAGVAVPGLWSTPRLLAVSTGWILLLVGVSFLVFRRRDL